MLPLHGHGGDVTGGYAWYDSKLVALDRDRGQCIPDRSVAGFPSAHTDNDAQRVRAEDRQCDDHGERHY